MASAHEGRAEKAAFLGDYELDGASISDAASDLDIAESPRFSDRIESSTVSKSSPSATRRFVSRLPQSSRPSRFTCIAISVVTVIALFGGGVFIRDKYYEVPPDGLSPPVYPSPKGGTARSWADSYAKAAELVANMSVLEKVNVTTGTGWMMGLSVGNTGPASHVGFPGLALQDGPLGLRFADNSTALPAGVTVGATFNKDLMYRHGAVHGAEARLKGVNVLLGPCVGPLGRMPAGGRNWEGFGPDPYLQGVAGAETVRGIQDQGVMATIKHFVANEQEHFRQSWEWGLPNAISSNIDDRAMHELYAWPFADAVKAGVASVMCSYNMVNNSYACANSKLLNGILKDEMGFQGFVMSDWLAQRSGVASALAGLDMTMPGDGLYWAEGDSLWGPRLTEAVVNGSLPIERLDDMATRIVAAWYQLGQDDKELFDRQGPNFSSWTKEKMGLVAPGSPSEQDAVQVNQFVHVQGDHDEVARDVAAEGVVLLRNNGMLPLNRETKSRIGIYGEDAGPGRGPNYCKDRGCNQGTLGEGWGSGAVEFPYLVTPIEALRREFGDDIKLSEHLSNRVSFEKGSSPSEQDICVVFANSDSGEGFLTWASLGGDRNDLFLQLGGEDLITQVAQSCGGGEGSTLVVLHAVGPVLMERWIDLPGVGAVVLANLPGQESGNALADILFGDVNPSGHLPYTIGRTLEDYGEGGQVMYRPNAAVPQQDFKEGLYIDYRRFDKYDILPRFEFGFGLSYTTFKVAEATVTEMKPKSAAPSARPEPGSAPPKYDAKVPSAEDVVFPSSMRRLEKFIYPYLTRDEAAAVKKGEAYRPAGYDEPAQLSPAGGDQGGNPDLWEVHVRVSVSVENTGEMAGSAVPQLYLSYPPKEGVDFPVRVLRGFEKVHLEKGESKTVEFRLTRRDLSYWDVEEQNWIMVEGGRYKFSVGFSSRDLRVETEW